MQVIELLSRETVRVGLEGSDKTSVIEAMVELLADDPAVKDLDEVRRVVLEREEMMSTGVGKGLALPHGKTSAVTGNVAALALTRLPVDFEAIDDQPVRLVFLLVGTPESKSLHVKILSRISRLMNRDEVRQRMVAAKTDQELYQAVLDGEAALLET
jgi:PTS system fructose-specific IIA component